MKKMQVNCLSNQSYRVNGNSKNMLHLTDRGWGLTSDNNYPHTSSPGWRGKEDYSCLHLQLWKLWFWGFAQFYQGYPNLQLIPVVSAMQEAWSWRSDGAALWDLSCKIFVTNKIHVKQLNSGSKTTCLSSILCRLLNVQAPGGVFAS